jgi:hypothetical protein
MQSRGSGVGFVVAPVFVAVCVCMSPAMLRGYVHSNVNVPRYHVSCQCICVCTSQWRRRVSHCEDAERVRAWIHVHHRRLAARADADMHSSQALHFRVLVKPQT